MAEILPLNLIRQHTKTDDDPAIDNTLLSLYRRAALEEAERWTGWRMDGRKTVTEFITIPQRFTFSAALTPNARRPFTTIFLKHRPNSGRVIVNGGGLESPVELTVGGMDGRALRVFPDIFPSGFNCCVNGCGKDNPITVTYSTGADCEIEVPAIILLGALQLIAFYIAHPGDVVGYNGKNDAVRQSGAAEIWARFGRVAA